MEIEGGWLTEVEKQASPFYSKRSQVIDLLVIHNISLPPGEFGTPYVADLFCDRLDCDEHPYFDQLRDLHVSAHLLIDRQGKITQFVSFDDQAWHAGVSSFQGRECCNEFSIGIELEGTDTLPYENIQYQTVTKVTQLLMQTYPAITSDRITGHVNIAPSRKTDPGIAFDWDRYFSLIVGQ